MEFLMGVCLVGLLVCLCVGLMKWNEIKYSRKGLPPGTMGWPLFGETTDFLKQGPDFMKNQKANCLEILLLKKWASSIEGKEVQLYCHCHDRHGSVFKTHILGVPAVVSMDPELNRYILLNEGKGLVPGYPKSMLDILGKCNIAAVQGSTHKYIRGSLLSLIAPTVIKDQFFRSQGK